MGAFRLVQQKLGFDLLPDCCYSGDCREGTANEMILSVASRIFRLLPPTD